MKKRVFAVLLTIILCGCIPSVSFAEAETLPFVLEPQYEAAYTFNRHGLAEVRLPQAEGGYEGVINLRGERVFGFDGTEFSLRKNGLIMAVGENDKAAFFSSEGKQLTEYVYETFKRVQPKTPHFVTYHYVTDYFDGDGESDLVPICREGKFGFINSSGEEAIPPAFNYVFGFYEGISRIGYDGVLSEYGTYTQCKFGYINEKGEPLTNPLWAASDFRGGYARIADGQYKVIDKSGQEVQFPTGAFEFIETNGNFILAGHDGGHVVLDMNGNLLSDWAPNIQLFGKSFIIWQKQIADINGNIIYTAPEGAWIYPLLNSYVVRVVAGISMEDMGAAPFDGEALVNQNGKVILQAKEIREVAEGIFYTPEGQALYDVNGKCIATLTGCDVYTSNQLSHKLLPVQSADNNKWGYVELPKVSTSFLAEYTENENYHVEKMIETEYGTVIYGYHTGVPHGASPGLHLLRPDGEDIFLSEPVSFANVHYARPEHHDIRLSEDGNYVTFSVSFDDRLVYTPGSIPQVFHDAGTYDYKANLKTGETIETRFTPLDTLGEDVISAWAKQEVEKSIGLGFVPTPIRDNYKRNITRAEFAHMAMDFLSFSYGYSNAKHLQTWSEVDYEKWGYVNHDFLCAYCHAKPDRNGEPFMSGGKPYEYNSNLAITMVEPFEKTEDFLYYDSVIAAYNIGIVNGVSETEFNPNGDITRQEAAAMLRRVYKNYGHAENAENGYVFADDAEIADWAKKDVYAIHHMGIMEGVGNDTFAPLEHYTVEQAIATFLRLYEKAPISRKNKNIAPLLEMDFEIEKVLEGNPAGRVFSSDRKDTVFGDYTIIQGAWNMRHYGSSDAMYAFYKSGGVTSLQYGHRTSEVEMDAENNTICYSATISDTFRLYNRLCGAEKVYGAGMYRFTVDIETGNILDMERIL